VHTALRNFSALLLTTLYCFGMVVAAGPFTHAGEAVPINTKADYCFANSSGDVYSHTSQTTFSSSNVVVLPAKPQKASSEDLWAICATADALIVAGFSQYTDYSANVRIHFRKADLIFPFHYFW
jgi:hypothetical protein